MAPVDGGSHFGPSASLSGVPPLNFEAHAGLAPSLTRFGDIRVLWRKLMPSLAMGSFVDGFYSSSYGNRNLLRIGDLRTFRDHFGKGEPPLCSFDDGINLSPADIGQFPRLVPRPIDSNPSGCSRISGLFDRGCPAAIPRLIVSICVDTVERVLRGWFWPHVAFEVSETHPLVAYRNAPPAVVLPVLELGIKTPSFHAQPRAIERGLVLKRHSADSNGYTAGDNTMTLLTQAEFETCP